MYSGFLTHLGLFLHNNIGKSKWRIRTSTCQKDFYISQIKVLLNLSWWLFVHVFSGNMSSKKSLQ